MYRLARQSVTRMIVDAMENWPGKVQYYEFDGHAEGNDLPESDLFGLIGFSCVQNGQFHDLTFGVVIMTLDDPGLDRSTVYVDWFYKRLALMQKFPVYNEDGSLTDFEVICFDGTAASPMSQVDARPTADLQVSARLTRAGQQPQ